MKEMKAPEHKSNICRPCASKQDNQQNRVMAEINSSMYKYSWSNLCNIFFKGRQKPSLWIFKETPRFSWNSKVCDEWVVTSSRTVCTKKSVMLFLLTCFQHKSFHLGVRSHTRLSYEKELQSIFTGPAKNGVFVPLSSYNHSDHRHPFSLSLPLSLSLFPPWAILVVQRWWEHRGMLEWGNKTETRGQGEKERSARSGQDRTGQCEALSSGWRWWRIQLLHSGITVTHTHTCKA